MPHRWLHQRLVCRLNDLGQPVEKSTYTQRYANTTKRQSHWTEELRCESTQPLNGWIQLKLCSPVWTFVLECATGAYPRCFFPLLSSSNSRVGLPCGSIGHQQVSHKPSAGKLAARAPELSLHRKAKNRKPFLQHACDTMKKPLPDTGRGSCNARSNRILSCSEVQFHRMQDSGFESIEFYYKKTIKYGKWPDRPSNR